MLFAIIPNDLEGAVAAGAMLTKEVVGDPDVACVFGSSVVVGQVDAWAVILVDGYGAPDSLPGHSLDDVEDP